MYKKQYINESLQEAFHHYENTRENIKLLLSECDDSDDVDEDLKILLSFMESILLINYIKINALNRNIANETIDPAYKEKIIALSQLIFAGDKMLNKCDGTPTLEEPALMEKVNVLSADLQRLVDGFWDNIADLDSMYSN